MSEPLSRPLACVQHDWPVDVEAGHGAFWVSVARQHGKIAVDKSGALAGDSPAFSASLASNKTLLRVTHASLGTFGFLRPQHSFTLPTQLNDVALSPAGGLLLAAGENGHLSVHLATAGTLEGQLRQLKGHVGGVYCVRVFPSGEVALSGGADHKLRVWSLVDGSCAQTMFSHTAGVTGLAIVERGRNILSCSRDGSVKLWDVGTNQVLRNVWPDESRASGSRSTSLVGPTLHVVSIGQLQNPAAAESALPSAAEHEVGTAGKLVLFGGDSRTLHGVDLRAHRLALSPQLPANITSVQCLDIAGDGLHFLAGTAEGEVLKYDLRDSTRPLHRFFRHAAPITRVIASKSPALYEFVAATNEGQVFLWPTESHDCLTLDLTGPEYDAVVGLAQVDAGILHTGCIDGAVRTYNLSLALGSA